MSNVMGGGGGRGGFRHMLDHLGPAMQGWLKDMRANEYQYTPENAEKLDKSVQEELDVHDVATVEQQRDEILVRLLKDKKAASAIV
jgi:3-hydroxyacyl-CoA dehydrogenase